MRGTTNTETRGEGRLVPFFCRLLLQSFILALLRTTFETHPAVGGCEYAPSLQRASLRVRS